LGLVALVLPLAAPVWAERAGDASAAESPQHTYAGQATATGVGVVYDRKNLLPVSPLFSAAMPRTTSQFDSAPTSASRGSPFDPGILASGRAASQLFGAPPDLIPPYPLFADATYPAGPASAQVGSAEVLGGQAAAEAESTKANAVIGQGAAGSGGKQDAVPLRASPQLQATVDALRSSIAALLGRYRAARNQDRAGSGGSDGALISVREATASTALEHRGLDLVERASSELRDVSLLGGAIHIESVVSSAETHIPGREAGKTDLTSSLQGMDILGVPATLTAEGLRLEGQALPVPADVTKAVEQAFAGHGFTLRADERRAEGAGAHVIAFRMGFTGSVQPGETDSFEMTLGTSALSWHSRVGDRELDAPVAADPGPGQAPQAALPGTEELASPPGPAPEPAVVRAAAPWAGVSTAGPESTDSPGGMAGADEGAGAKELPVRTSEPAAAATATDAAGLAAVGNRLGNLRGLAFSLAAAAIGLAVLLAGGRILVSLKRPA
jgi:hypothetical protein